MQNRIMSILIISLLILSSFLIYPIFDPDVSAEEESDEGTVVNQYYLENKTHKSAYLVPYEPDDGPDKFVIIGYGEYLNTSQGLVDRKYNPDIKPGVELYIDSGGVEGLLITVRLEFRYFVDDKVPLDADVIAFFDQYETDGDDEPEPVKIRSSYYSNTPIDITASDYGAIMHLSVSFEGGDVNDTIKVLCGEGGYHSFVTTPYDRSYSSTLIDENGDETVQVNTALCYIVGIIFIVIIVIFIVYAHFKDRS